MESNPWQVDSIDIFYWLKCPECMFFSQEELDFKDHAMGNHPRSYTLFGNFEDNEDQGNLLRDIDNFLRNHHTHPCTALPCKTLFSPMYCPSKNMHYVDCLGLMYCS